MKHSFLFSISILILSQSFKFAYGIEPNEGAIIYTPEEVSRNEAVREHDGTQRNVRLGIARGLDEKKLGEEWGIVENNAVVTELQFPLGETERGLYRKVTGIAPKVGQLIGLIGSNDRNTLARFATILDSEEKIQIASEVARLEILRLNFVLETTPSETPIQEERVTPVSWVDGPLWWNTYDLTIRIAPEMTEAQILQAVVRSLTESWHAVPLHKARPLREYPAPRSLP